MAGEAEVQLVAFGLSHHTAPVELRERLACSRERVPELLDGFRSSTLGSEAVVVSTCNRGEIYAVADAAARPEDLVGWLAGVGGLRTRTVLPHVYTHVQEQAVHHLFRVAASLDSMVVGEGQILGQVREAYRVAKACDATGPVLHRLMDRALHVAKRVHTETSIARGGVSMGRAGVDLASQVFGGLQGRSVLLIGAGAHGKLVARTMLDRDLGELVVANRDFARASELARQLESTAVHLDEVERYLDRVDVVVTSTAAGRVLIDRGMVAAAQRNRRHRRLVFIDLSVPRNVATDVNDLDGVYRFDVDDLNQVAAQGRAQRQEASVEAERIVEAEAAQCWSRLQGAALHQRIGAVVQRAEGLRIEELARLQPLLAGLGGAEREAVDAMSRALVKKILHGPLADVRRFSESGLEQEAEILLRSLGEGEEGT